MLSLHAVGIQQQQHQDFLEVRGSRTYGTLTIHFGKKGLVFSGGPLSDDLAVVECAGGRNIMLASVFARKNNRIDALIVSGGRYEGHT